MSSKNSLPNTSALPSSTAPNMPIIFFMPFPPFFFLLFPPRPAKKLTDFIGAMFKLFKFTSAVNLIYFETDNVGKLGKFALLTSRCRISLEHFVRIQLPVNALAFRKPKFLNRI
jgi:hypothetical protein